MMRSMEVVDPTKQLTGSTLRDLIVHCIEFGRLSIGWHGGQDRMAERGITGGQILAALSSGALSPDGSSGDGTCRYLARKNDVAVCFCFDVDEDGNLLVIITVMRKE